MHARMLPSKPKAWPLWTTKSLKYGFSPVDVQRSSTRPPAGAVRDREAAHADAAHAVDRVDQDVAVRVTAGCTMRRRAAHGAPRARVPSAGATLVAPAPLQQQDLRDAVDRHQVRRAVAAAAGRADQRGLPVATS